MMIMTMMIMIMTRDMIPSLSRSPGSLMLCRRGRGGLGSPGPGPRAAGCQCRSGAELP